MKNYVYAHTETKQDYQRDKSITSKHWQVYYYMLSQSYYNSIKVEDHRYLYKNKFSVGATAKFLKMSRQTVYNAINKLKLHNLIREKDEAYLIYYRNSTKINNDTLKQLLEYNKEIPKNIDLLRTYLIIKRIAEVARSSEDMCFTKKDLVQLLGHSIHTMSDYDDVRNYLIILSYFNLIELKIHTATSENVGSYTIYHIQAVNDKADKEEELVHTIGDTNISILPEYIVNAITNI